MRRLILLLVSLLVPLFAAGEARALDKLRVGKSGVGIIFTGLEVGQEAGIWQSVGLDIEPVQFNGEAQFQQALAAGEVEIGFGSASALGYRQKGVPAIGIAAAAGAPNTFVLIVPADSKLKSADDLKGKHIATTTAGSFTDWLVHELARQKGWGPQGIETVALGADRSRIAAMKTGDVDGTILTTERAFEYEEQGQARILVSFGDYVKDFHAHVFFASDRLIAQHPELVTRFLQGWFKTVAYMKSHKDVGVRIAAKQLGISEHATAQAYDEETKAMSDDGAFSPAAIEVVRRSLVELGILPTPPDAASLYSTQFVPVKF